MVANLAPKDRWIQLTDADEIAAITAQGKWREVLPTWVRDGGKVWVLADEIFKAWREARANTGKIRCQK